MPSLSILLLTSLPVLLIAILYQTGFLEHVPFQVLPNLFLDTHCYTSVNTLSSKLPQADCFTVSDGKFTSVFVDHASDDATKQARSGYVYPGLWDGHGHLIQFGESLGSVSLFGAESMKEVQKRLVKYKAGRSEVGTREQWLRGVGWDQAHFEGKWPTSVRLYPVS
jgi:predicted amidohydrolase YtcJ